MKLKKKNQIYFKDQVVMRLEEKHFKWKPINLVMETCGWSPDIILIPEEYKDEFWNNKELQNAILPSLPPWGTVAYYKPIKEEK